MAQPRFMVWRKHPSPFGLGCPFTGRPQCGQLGALSDTLCPQSGQVTNDTAPPRSVESSRAITTLPTNLNLARSLGRRLASLHLAHTS